MTEIDPELKHLLAPYLERRQQDLLLIRTALQSGDFATVAEIGHRIRGNAGNLGLDPLGKLAADLEDAANAKNMAATSVVVEEMTKFLHHLSSEEPA